MTEDIVGALSQLPALSVCPRNSTSVYKGKSVKAETIAAELKGVGLSKARAIVEYRKKHGPFKNPEDLSLVKGIGDRTVEMNLADIKVKNATKK